MDTIKIAGSDNKCVISGENFSYTFENGHPVMMIKDGQKVEPLAYPTHNGKEMKSKARIVHKYWNSVLVITRYRYGFETIEIKYHILPTGEIKQEHVY